MEARLGATASPGQTLGVCAFACALLSPAMFLFSVLMGYVWRLPLALLAPLSFCAALPLGLIAWRMGSRELKLHVASGLPGDPPRQASRARELGRAAVVLWVVLVLFAALTYTSKAA